VNVLLILTGTRLEAKIAPHFEFTLPSGNISERLEQQFNNLNTVFALNFNFINITPVFSITPSFLMNDTFRAASPRI
jgi:hypothetical protein